MATQTRQLSKLKEVFCIECYTELLPSLAERRGEKPLICPVCKTSFTIKQAENFIKNLDPILEGQCPNCMTVLVFSIEDRSSKKKVRCPKCKETFYLNEVENPLTATTSEKYISKKSSIDSKKDIISLSIPQVLLKNYKTYVILSIFLDFFFVFTILSLTESSKIKKQIYSWKEEDKLSFNTWHTVFVIVIFLKIISIVLGFIQYLDE